MEDYKIFKLVAAMKEDPSMKAVFELLLYNTDEDVIMKGFCELFVHEVPAADGDFEYYEKACEHTVVGGDRMVCPFSSGYGCQGIDSVESIWAWLEHRFDGGL